MINEVIRIEIESLNIPFEIFIIDFLEMEIARRGFDFGSFMWDVKENFSLVL